eukprot:7265256-Prymnesium_polylepis.1
MVKLPLDMKMPPPSCECDPVIVLRLCMVKLDASIATAPPWAPDCEPTIELPFDNIASEPVDR